MSSTNFNINEPTYYESNGVTLLFGTMETNASPPNAIHLPSIETNDCHVVLSKDTHAAFKTAIFEAPLTSKSIQTYDQLGHVVGRYENGRKNNSSGNLSILSDPVTLLSNIVFPKTPDTNTIYLPMTNYRGLFQPQALEARRMLFDLDITAMKKNVDLSRVHLLISSVLLKPMEPIVTLDQLKTIFGKVTEVTSGDCITYLVELICGKTISGNSPIFQGLLNFGDNIDVLGVKGMNTKTSNAPVQLLARRNGRIQVTTNGQHGSYVFMAILRKKVPMESFSITEEITDTNILIDPSMLAKPDTFGFNTEYIDNYVKALEYRFKLSLKTDKGSQLAFVERHTSDTVKMLFKNDSVIPDFDVSNKNSFTKLLYSEYGTLMSETVRNLHQIMIDNSKGSGAPPAPLLRFNQYHTSMPHDSSNYLDTGCTPGLDTYSSAVLAARSAAIAAASSCGGADGGPL